MPEFEVERTKEETAFDRIESYPEYPGVEHPMPILARVLAEMGIRSSIGADSDGYPGILGYQGPSLTAVTDARVEPLGDAIEGWMARKSPAEIELIRQSARWCEHAHRLLQQYSVPGATEAEASLRAGYEATLAMLEALGPEYAGQLGSQDGATAGYRGQIGRRSAWAHAVAHNITFEDGDMLVTETAAPIWGYNAELERGMVVGTPTDEQRRLHEHVVAAQQVAFDAFRPGVTSADVDQAVTDYFDDERPPSALAAAHGPRDRPAQPRGAVPGRRRPHPGRAGDGVHDRARRLRRGARRLPPQRHRRRHRRRHRDPHGLPARPRQPDHRLISLTCRRDGNAEQVFLV